MLHKSLSMPGSSGSQNRLEKGNSGQQRLMLTMGARGPCTVWQSQEPRIVQIAFLGGVWFSLSSC